MGNTRTSAVLLLIIIDMIHNKLESISELGQKFTDFKDLESIEMVNGINCEIEATVDFEELCAYETSKLFTTELRSLRNALATISIRESNQEQLLMTVIAQLSRNVFSFNAQFYQFWEKREVLREIMPIIQNWQKFAEVICQEIDAENRYKNSLYAHISRVVLQHEHLPITRSNFRCTKTINLTTTTMDRFKTVNLLWSILD